MQSNTAVKFAPAVTEDRRIDLAIENDQAVIKLSEWTDGLGWCTQKTMKLDLEMLDEMQRLVTAARMRIRGSKAESGEKVATGNVLRFPQSL